MNRENPKVLVLGGGITGMAAAYLHWYYNSNTKVTIVTNKMGGEYFSGGLKYIHNTPATRKFITDLGFKPKVKKVNGALLLYHGIEPYPEYFIRQPEQDRDNIQKSYYIKTRPESNIVFNSKCMNNPYHFSDHLALEFDQEMANNMVEAIKTYHNIEIKKIDDVFLRDVMSPLYGSYKKRNTDFKWDKIIYTLPIQNLYNIVMNGWGGFRFKAANLVMFQVLLMERDNIWWDYLYVPYEEDGDFHRLSLVPEYHQHHPNEIRGYVIQIEVNAKQSDLVAIMQLRERIRADFDRLNKRHLGLDNYVHSKHHTMIKGHFIDAPSQHYIDDFKKRLPKNIMLLGRYAQWEKVSFHNVVEKIYKEVMDGKVFSRTVCSN
jgi:hypothetical protein